MELGIKDLIYIGVYVASLAALYSRFSSELKENKKDIRKLSDFFKRVILDDDGQIKLVNKSDCKEKEAVINDRINEGKKSTTEALKKIDEVNQNVLLIMYHLKIDRDSIKLPRKE